MLCQEDGVSSVHEKATWLHSLHKDNYFQVDLGLKIQNEIETEASSIDSTGNKSDSNTAKDCPSQVN